MKKEFDKKVVKKLSYKNSSIKLLIEYVRSWLKTAEVYKKTSYYTLNKGRALLNMERAVGRLDEITPEQFDDLIELCDKALDTYVSTRGHFNRWKKAKDFLIHAKNKVGCDEPVTVDLFILDEKEDTMSMFEEDMERLLFKNNTKKLRDEDTDRMFTAKWGTYGPKGVDTLKYVRLIDLSTEHLINILTTQLHITMEYRFMIRDILRQRKVL